METPDVPMGADSPHAGLVTVCTARDCLYNEDTKCNANGIMVNFHETHADCNTYTRNQHIPGTMMQEQ